MRSQGKERMEKYKTCLYISRSLPWCSGATQSQNLDLDLVQGHPRVFLLPSVPVESLSKDGDCCARKQTHLSQEKFQSLRCLGRWQISKLL